MQNKDDLTSKCQLCSVHVVLAVIVYTGLDDAALLSQCEEYLDSHSLDFMLLNKLLSQLSVSMRSKSF